MTQRIELPTLGSIYRQAAADALKSRLSSNGSLKALPKEAVVTEHPGITAEKVEQYRELFGGEVFDGVHRRALPSVLVHIAAFPVQMALMSRRDFPLPLLGMVHLTNAVEHHQPVFVGQPLQILSRAENLRPHRKGTQADILVEVSADGQLLWSSVSSYLGRGAYMFSRSEHEQVAVGSRDFTAPAKTGLWNLGADTGRKYAAVSGDYNPIHVSGLSAKLLGQPRAIAHGMYSAARMLEGREPESAGHSWAISFEAPVALPGRVAFAAEEKDERTLEFTGWHPRKQRRHFTGELQLP